LQYLYTQNKEDIGKQFVICLSKVFFFVVKAIFYSLWQESSQ